jgi:hypothetical protein
MGVPEQKRTFLFLSCFEKHRRATFRFIPTTNSLLTLMATSSSSSQEGTESNPKRAKLATKIGICSESDKFMHPYGVPDESGAHYHTQNQQQIVEALQRNTNSNDQLRLAIEDMKHDLHLSQAIPTLASLGQESVMIKEQVMEFNEGVRLTQMVNKALEANCLASIRRIDQDLVNAQKVLSRLVTILLSPANQDNILPEISVLENARACLRTYYHQMQYPL